MRSINKEDNREDFSDISHEKKGTHLQCNWQKKGYPSENSSVTVSINDIIKYIQPIYESVEEIKESVIEEISVIKDRIKNVENNVEHIVKTSGYEQYLIVPINDVFIKDKKIKLSKEMSLIIQFENGQYIVSYNNLGLLAVNDSLDDAINEIQIDFSGLWDDYVLCPEEELAIDGIIFKNKLKEYINGVIL